MDPNCSCNGEHSHECEIGVQYTLYQKINKEEVECLNEREDGSGVAVFKPWEERLTRDKVRENFDALNKLSKLAEVGGHSTFRKN